MSAHVSWTSVLRMSAPVFIFGVILPFVDIGTDFRLIYRLYSGVLGCKIPTSNGSTLDNYDWKRNRECRFAKDVQQYCHENPEECFHEPHKLFASLLLGMVWEALKKVTQVSRPPLQCNVKLRKLLRFDIQLTIICLNFPWPLPCHQNWKMVKSMTSYENR